LSTKSDDLITVTPVATVKTVDLTEAAVRLHPADEVAVARVPLAPGLRLRMDAGVVRVGRLIPSGHKVALRPVAVGDAVHKYGQVIGFATMPIAPGDHAHSHNLGVGSLTHDYAIGVDVKPVAYAPESARRAFMGFRRPDGRAGTRNYVAVISTVNCSASTVRAIADRFRPGASGGDILRDYPTVDGIIGLTHKGGCGARYGSREIDLLQRTLAGVARHPNVAAYVFVGLGCEINQIQDLVSAQGLEQDRPPLLVIQDEGGLQETVEAGVAAVKELLPLAAAYKREEIPASELVVALQCGGSDGWSGVTANPALGRAADLLVRQGGTVALGETPEVYGAEHMLTRRAAAPAVAERLLERIHWWEEYTRRNGCEIDNNPSPGNKLGGLTTIYEKSLGAVAKGGSTPLAGVYRVRRAHRGARLRTCGHTRLRPHLSHGAGRLGLHHGRVHDRARLGVRLQARAEHQGSDEQRALPEDAQRHGRRRRPRARRRDPRRGRGGDLRAHPGRGFGRTEQERAPRHRRGRVQPLDYRRDAMTPSRYQSKESDKVDLDTPTFRQWVNIIRNSTRGADRTTLKMWRGTEG